ncbi:MAG: UPF0147 family protein [Canidatus Methanoxibalbensis ujae]|nr:UPF0147 family protein [Candidatus Methanoxibalbensis ujae]MCW7078857.1 UPF0147 family protein [Candidatus Methanoxibalbensis ujae]RLG38622.1 MAG: hypothetical protein DRN79_01270 [Methanosarcinales archaeon]
MKRKEKEEVLRRCAEMLERIMNDVTVPRNIRKSAESLKEELLNGEGSIAMRATSAISALEELTSDPNMPSHARTIVWSIVGQLETISVEE